MTPARGLVIAAARSGSGKTIVTLGLMRALARRGTRVAGLKNGPDYIDPAFHAAATGVPSRNIDSWAMSPDLALSIAADAGEDADLVLCEGSMGLFDGVPGAPGRSGSSADIAALLGWPVLLVHDCSGQSQSAAALLSGLAGYDPRLRIAGVILNRIGSERHRRLVAGAVEAQGLTVFGAIPRSDVLGLPERHLGLVQAGETADLEGRLEAFADEILRHVDLDAILNAASAGTARAAEGVGALLPPPGQRIAIARDAAFSFLYPHLLDGWRRAGAELMFFSPLADEALPAEADCCWLPGGYPELHAGRIAGAARFLSGLRAFAETRPVHGECGGYMVLGRTLIDAAGRGHAMAGLLAVETSFARRRMTIGYRDARVLDNASFEAGARLRGHEFHYATLIREGDDEPFAEVLDAYGAGPTMAGSRRGSVSGSFFHALAGG